MGEGAFRDRLRRRIAVARGDEPADLVLRGGRILSVFTGELLDTDVAITGQHVAGLGRYEGRETVDVSGLVLVPGLIDGHMHLETTKLTVDEFARAVLPHGTTTAVIDPHEIANVFGLEGVRALLLATEKVPLDLYVMVSSCVPASPFESANATVEAADIARFLAEEPRALGIAEMMNFPGVVAAEEGILAKIETSHRAGRHIDGHAPGLTGHGLNAYLAAGVRSDHECVSYEEALEKRRLGMWIMIREGSAARNLEGILPLVLEYGSRNCMLVTDDREPDQLLADGHMDDVVRRAISLGCPPEEAVAMATLQPARYHRLHDRGALAPGFVGDVVAADGLDRFRPVMVWKRGRLVAEDGRATPIPRVPPPEWMRHSVRVRALGADDFRARAGGRVRVIGVRPGEIVTLALEAAPAVRDGEVIADPSRDLAKVAVVERHRETGRIGLGLVSGFDLRRGALASTHAHDAHNVVVVGIEESDMAAAVNRLAEIGGGQVAVAEGSVVAELACPVGGLLSELPAEEVAAATRGLEDAARRLGVTLPAPFMAMSFLALSVIPELKITDRGLVDTVRFELVPLGI